MEHLVLQLFLFCITQALPTNRSPPAEVDVFDVAKPDIFEINQALNLHLLEGDIKYPESEKQRSTIRNKAMLWAHTIPYYLDSNLDLNAKGIILQAFDMFRLKSCIDFVPWTGEQDYLSVVKAYGCWSYVGKQRGPQTLSIGYGCDDISIVEHELLHLLGFWHEQSRTDRDDYVIIQWTNIEEDSSLALLDRCTFDDLTTCGMEQIATDDADWHWVSETTEDLFTSEIDDGGPYLLFNSTAASPGDVAVIETRVLQPQRTQQCLQIYYQHKGSRDDQLQIAISHPSNSSQFKVVSSIPAANINQWTLAQVPLSESNPFRLALRAVAGVSAETGGWAVDDLTLMELSCFPHIWHITNFTSILDDTTEGSAIYSPRFNSTDGYSFQLSMYPNVRQLNNKSIGLFVHLTSGYQDDELQWPCPWKQITMSVMDQNSDVRLRMSRTNSFTTNPNLETYLHGSLVFIWDRPDKIGYQVDDHGSTYFRGPGYGYNTFLPHVYLHRRQYIRHRDMVILINFEDISHLLKPQLVDKLSTTNSPTTQNSGATTSLTTDSQTTGDSGETMSLTTNSQTTGNSRATTSLTSQMVNTQVDCKNGTLCSTFETSVCSNCESSTTVRNDGIRHQDTILYAWITIWSIALISGGI